MTQRLNVVLLFLLLSACAQQPQKAQYTTQPGTDEFLWLEEVESQQAINWVKARNKKSLQVLEKHPKFNALYEQNKALYNSNDRIPFVTQMDGYLYNFWRDEEHVRGIYRRTTLAEYRKDNPAWETVLDVDALAEQEQENWVYKGMSCNHPVYDRCMVNLSRGGADALVVKEFDLASKTFVKDGFFIPESKNGLAWVDRDTLLVAPDLGPDSMTDSGYARTVRGWRRGTELADAPIIFEGKTTDVGVWPAVVYDGDQGYQFIVQSDSFYTRNWYILDANNQTQQLALPRDISFAGLINGQAIFDLKSDWQPAAQNFKQGSLIAIDFQQFLAGSTAFELIMEPAANMSISSINTAKNFVLVNTLQDVNSVMYQLSFEQGQWRSQQVELPAYGAMSVSGSSSESDDIFIDYSNFLTPTTLYHYDAKTQKAEALKSLPHQFQAEGFQVEQHFMTAQDQTQVPYYVVMKEDLVYDGNNPTILYGYGGFEVSMTPFYSSTMGTNWLNRGGVFVLANIRGGGEYGPAWHQAALKANRHIAFNDFIGVAEDLIAKGITSPQHLGIQGGSNGGLLVGAVMTQRPDLFNAVVCSVPLLDMKRYNKLLAGASWMGEYGDPDIPEEWAFIKTYSPYHNLQADAAYPKVFFTTSTRDDRVHPGHARKMAAKMEAMGHNYFYYENIEGGHGGASNNDQSAYLRALTYTYFWHQLGQ